MQSFKQGQVLLSYNDFIISLQLNLDTNFYQYIFLVPLTLVNPVTKLNCIMYKTQACNSFLFQI